MSVNRYFVIGLLESVVSDYSSLVYLELKSLNTVYILIYVYLFVRSVKLNFYFFKLYLHVTNRS